MPMTPRRSPSALIWLAGVIVGEVQLIGPGASANSPTLRCRLRVEYLGRNRASIAAGLGVWDDGLVRRFLDLDPGAAIEVEGRPSLSVWTDNRGEPRPSLSVIVTGLWLPGDNRAT